ncbi:VRR-NUC domain-containing protein [Burkholderia sp. RF4-BP95]|uniref:VRR-NUC domain-containing protein n=1 Tax=Burkholderia sp. RF4-BP95 TaxID=1637845 RepID=UPI000753EFED|nr:VRR-NUC domain-containing protein [Burkholderia sp. RF4-BP95]KUY81239.1 nuclease [Burkholderia sp. RF4-BP95]
MGGTLQPAGSTCTTINEDPAYARLPPITKGYLQEKVEFALKMPKIVYVRLPDGTTTVNLLKQVAMTAAIRRDEVPARFYFPYKAEVSFDMSPWYASGRVIAPIPFLSADVSEGPGRRHSLNPWPKGRVIGMLRRPDVIIVKNPADRWPGRGTVDLTGGTHVDNMLRLVEVKFPGDTWGVGQERDYQGIAGDFINRMTVIDVADCNRELEKVREWALKNVPAPESQREQERLRAPIRTTIPVAEPVWYEEWWSWARRHGEEAADAIGNEIAPLWDAASRGFSYLSEETKAFLHNHAPWVFTAGRWIADKASDAWVWIDEKGHEVYRYTTAQLKAGWDEIVRQTDLTWEVLTSIDWAQVGMTIVKAIVVIVVVVAAVAIAIVLAEALLAILAALIAIVAAGAEAAAALAVALGITETAAGVGALGLAAAAR